MTQAIPTQILLSQGRIADRTPGAIPGAAALAGALARKTGLAVTASGSPAPAQVDHWDSALVEAGRQLAALAAGVTAALRLDGVVVSVVNTCSAALATLPAAAAQVEGLAVLWIDAHADYNTPATTGSGYLGGMALAGASGLWDSGHGAGIAPARSLLIGARDIDPAEAVFLRQHGATVMPPAAVTPAAVAEWVGARPIWIHIDWDVMEPGPIPAAYAVPGGLRPAQLKAVLAALPRRQIVGIELAELELPADPAAADLALATILDITDPLLPMPGQGGAA